MKQLLSIMFMGLLVFCSCEKSEVNVEQTAEPKTTYRTQGGEYSTSVGEIITEAEAVAQMDLWKSHNDSSVTGVFVGNDILQQIIDQPNSTGAMIYFAEDQPYHNTVVLVGVDSSGNDLIYGTLAGRFRPWPCSSLPCLATANLGIRKLGRP